MMSGVDGKLAHGMLIGRLGREKKFAYEEKHDTGLPHCTSVATRWVPREGDHLRGRYKRPIIDRGVPKTIQPFLESGVPTQVGSKPTKYYGKQVVKY